MPFILVLSLWIGVSSQPHYYKFEMQDKKDCEALLDVLESYPKVAAPDIHATCIPKSEEKQ